MANLTPQEHVTRITEALADVHAQEAVLAEAQAATREASAALRRKISYLHRRLHRAATEHPELLGMTGDGVAMLSAGGEKE